ncbi:hypothetical protein BJY16_007611 [Actinoplanes octamycinicus]|uniref:Uncharacterized protein n=1 Tax=Actinoplanes octamycinicus TaxID=135948 RepID=A0A7W7MBK7_9ACTN|nr:hypothetical protein [Actinoplanes octamycinicus]MBB4744152.1 hypothetical protein [Actinoplanes octamycinicus]GIE56892.1 hypothetical protein Aoc01nite_22940 [Actinoplanes octamycinicus]
MLSDPVAVRDEVPSGSFAASGEWVVGMNDNAMRLTAEATRTRRDTLARVGEV